jgi:hypothetical protein
MFLKILYKVSGWNCNVKCLSTQFLEKDEIVYHWAAMSQRGRWESEGHIWDSAHADLVRSTDSEG